MDHTELARAKAEKKYGPEPRMEDDQFVSIGRWHEKWLQWKAEVPAHISASMDYLPVVEESLKVARSLTAFLEMHDPGDYPDLRAHIAKLEELLTP